MYQVWYTGTSCIYTAVVLLPLLLLTAATYDHGLVFKNFFETEPISEHRHLPGNEKLQIDSRRLPVETRAGALDDPRCLVATMVVVVVVEVRSASMIYTTLESRT